ncbi:tetratricopeptide repeat protein (plasmid) [Lacticaseibacillus paracasei]|uniref:tetratricopeptide repeat protein n=1 Tax=Lacticaseibacillus paracasei TaxID=1597 RepID=UPI00338FC0BF
MEKNLEKSEELFKQAQSSFIKNNYDNALNSVSAAILIDSTSQQYLYFRAVIYLTKGNYDEAIGDLTESLKLDKKNMNSLKLRAIAYGMTKNKNKALEDWDEIISNVKDNAECRFGRAVIEVQLKKYDSAIDDCEKFENDTIYGDETALLKVKILKCVLGREHDSNCEKVSRRLFKNESEPITDETLIGQVLNFLEACYEFLKSSKEAGQMAMGSVLYQYTGPKILTKICSLSEGEGKEKDFKLRLYDTTYMNDPGEGSVLINKIEYKGLECEENRPLHSPQPNVYIASLTKISPLDSAKGMSLWNSYGRSHTGTALGVRIERPSAQEKTIKKNEINTNLYKVFYVGDAKVQEYIDTMKENGQKIQKEIRDKTIANSVYSIMNHALQKVRFLYKEKFYSYEEEYRVIKESAVNMAHFEYNDPRLFVFVNENELDIQLAKITFGAKFENSYLWTPIIKRNLGDQIICDSSVIPYR